MLDATFCKQAETPHLIAAARTVLNALTSTPLELELLERLEDASQRVSEEQAEELAGEIEEGKTGISEDFLESAIEDALYIASTERGKCSLTELREEAQQLAEKLRTLQAEINGSVEYANSKLNEVAKTLTNQE